MTISDAIKQADELASNSVSYETKVSWLSELDGELWATVCSGYSDCDPDVCPNYSAADDAAETELLVVHPFCELYVYFLQAKIYYTYEEYSKFNAAMSMHERMRSQWRNYYNQIHTAKPVSLKYW